MDGWMKGWLGFSTVKQRDLTCKHPPGYWLLHAWSQRKLITVKRVLTWKAPPPSYFDGIEDDIAMKSKIPSFKEISWKPSSASEWAKTYRGWGGKKKRQETKGIAGYVWCIIMASSQTRPAKERRWEWVEEISQNPYRSLWLRIRRVIMSQSHLQLSASLAVKTDSHTDVALIKSSRKWTRRKWRKKTWILKKKEINNKD